MVAILHRWSLRRKSSWDSRAQELDVNVYCAQVCRSLFLSQALNVLDLWDRRKLRSDLFNDKNKQNGNILRTYRLLKCDIETSHYVKIHLPRKQISILASLRCGNLPINIERGRYTKPVTPLCDRLCTVCVGNNIENEMHFLIECPFYDTIRYSLFNKCMSIYNDFYSLSTLGKIKWLFNTDAMQYSLAHSISLMYNMRRLSL
jgi:hypothetical protein